MQTAFYFSHGMHIRFNKKTAFRHNWETLGGTRRMKQAQRQKSGVTTVQNNVFESVVCVFIWVVTLVQPLIHTMLHKVECMAADFCVSAMYHYLNKSISTVGDSRGY